MTAGRSAQHVRWLATLTLLAGTAAWGSTFYMIKVVLRDVPASDFLAVRFAIAAIVLLAVSLPQVRALSAAQLRHGVILGLLYGAGQFVQTVPLEWMSATVSGFITGMFVVFTPIIAAVVTKHRVPMLVWVAVLVAAAGLAVMSLNGFRIGSGELLTLASALLYACHIVALTRWSVPGKTLGLAAVQLSVIAVVTGLAAAPGGIELPSTSTVWTMVLYMALVAGAGAMIAQTWAQQHMSAARAAIIMTGEPVFAAGFALAFGGEIVGQRQIIGGLLVVAAMYLSEWATARDARNVEAV